MSTPDVTLTVHDGNLFTPFELLTDQQYRDWFKGQDVMLLRRYDAGDCDTIRWPNPNIEDLQAALYDAREMGHIPNGATVRLPDGIIVDF